MATGSRAGNTTRVNHVWFYRVGAAAVWTGYGNVARRDEFADLIGDAL